MVIVKKLHFRRIRFCSYRIGIVWQNGQNYILGVFPISIIDCNNGNGSS